jgi:hypothetical protein
MVGVDDLIADVEVQVSSTHKKAPGRRRVFVGKRLSTTSLLQTDYPEMGRKARIGAGFGG